MEIELKINPSAGEWTRTMKVVLETTVDPAFDIHAVPTVIEPTPADLMALVQFILELFSPSLADGKFPVSDHLRLFGRIEPVTALYRRASEFEKLAPGFGPVMACNIAPIPTSEQK